MTQKLGLLPHGVKGAKHVVPDCYREVFRPVGIVEHSRLRARQINILAILHSQLKEFLIFPTANGAAPFVGSEVVAEDLVPWNALRGLVAATAAEVFPGHTRFHDLHDGVVECKIHNRFLVRRNKARDRK